MNKIRRKKNVKKGIQFCLMVCGASGTGTLRPCGSDVTRCRLLFLLRMRQQLTNDIRYRKDHIREHALWPESAGAQGLGRPFNRTRGTGSADQADHCWYVARSPDVVFATAALRHSLTDSCLYRTRRGGNTHLTHHCRYPRLR